MDYLEKIKQLENDTPKMIVEWLKEWQELAQITYGITTQDPRFESVMRWLNICDTAFSIDSWSTFEEAAAMVKAIAKKANEAKK